MNVKDVSAKFLCNNFIDVYTDKLGDSESLRLVLAALYLHTAGNALSRVAELFSIPDDILRRYMLEVYSSYIDKPDMIDLSQPKRIAQDDVYRFINTTLLMAVNMFYHYPYNEPVLLRFWTSWRINFYELSHISGPGLFPFSWDKAGNIIPKENQEDMLSNAFLKFVADYDSPDKAIRMMILEVAENCNTLHPDNLLENDHISFSLYQEYKKTLVQDMLRENEEDIPFW